MENLKIHAGLLGGTFDPVHNGHLQLGQFVFEHFNLDSVWFLPCNISPHKLNRKTASGEQRIEMLRLALAHSSSFKLCDHEIRKGGTSYTVDTLKELESQHENTRFHWIMGLDSFNDVADWKSPTSLIQRCHILVATRAGFIPKNWNLTLNALSENFVERESSESYVLKNYLDPGSGNQLTLFQFTPLDISSSSIRNARNRQEIKNMLPPDVENYIIRHHLYLAGAYPIS